MESMSYSAPPDSQSVERSGPDEIRALQDEGLRRLMGRVAQGNRFYQEMWKQAGVRPDLINSVSDLRQLPFVTRADIEKSLENRPPFGDYQGHYPAVRVQASSGTYGKPKPIFHSRRDWENIGTFWARRLFAQGVRPADSVQNVFTYGLFIPGFTSTEGAMKLGALVIPTGSGAVTSSERQVLLAREWGATVLGGVPTYILHLASVAEGQGWDPRRDFRVRVTFHGGEPFTPETRRKLEERWGCKSYDNYGSVEQGAPTWECQAQDGYHINEDAYYYEVVDPKTGELLPDGEVGALVVTTLFKECAPMIRYMVGDLTSIVSEPCRCGRTFRRITGIRGRIDDMIKVRGVTIYPSAIEQVVRGFKELGSDYRIVLRSDGGLDVITVRCEMLRSDVPGALGEQLSKALKAATGLTCLVELTPPGDLSAGMDQMVKPKRVIDERRKSG